MVMPTATTLILPALRDMERLDFLLPDFVRTTWVSDEARAVWEPRFRQITRLWFELEWQSVVAGIRSCSVTMTSPDGLIEAAGVWATHGLSGLPVEMQGVSGETYASTSSPAVLGEPFVYRVVVGRPADVAAFKNAWDTNDHHTIGRLLGYPECCHRFFHHTWVEDGFIDTTWAMAQNGPSRAASERTIQVDGPLEANILWRWMGIRAVPHLPCAFDCQQTAALGQAMIQLGHELGYAKESAWLSEILSWPVEWSALHGIAEIKTPVLKVATRTDATAYKYVVQRPGEGYPTEGAHGLTFPYQQPAVPQISGRTPFADGIANPLPETVNYPAWYARDNGFRSVLGMQKAHQPLLDVAAEALSAEPAHVLDLGCGNGALLQELIARCPAVVPYGVDTSTAKLAHAAELLPAHLQNFVAGSLYDVSLLAEWEQDFDLVILMPGRLLEVPAAEGDPLREWLRRRARHILVYAYGDWLTFFDDLGGLTERAGLQLIGSDRTAAAGLAKVVQWTRP